MNPFTPEFEPYKDWTRFSMLPAQPFEAGQKRRVAVVGLGNQGAKLARATAEAGFQLVAICDSDARRLKEFKTVGYPEPKKVQDIRELQPSEIDICILATLADNHLALIRILTEIGFRSVLCEKPIVNQIRDLHDLQSLAREKRLSLGINHPKLWSPDFQLARAIMQSPCFGPPRRISLRFKSGGFGNIGCHQLAALFYLTGKSVTRVVSAAFDTSSGVSRKKNYTDPNGTALFDLEGIPVDVDNRKTSVSPPNRISFYFENVIFELLEEYNLFRCLDCPTGEDHQELFKMPWLGTKKSWPVIVHLLRNALIEVADGSDCRKFEAAGKAVEAIIAAQKTATTGEAVVLPLQLEIETPYLFS